MKLVLLFFIFLTTWQVTSKAQTLDGKWRWEIKGSSLDLQSDYVLELNLKQVDDKVYGTQTLMLKSYPNVVIWIEGTVDKYGMVKLKSGKPVQYLLPDSVFMAKDFQYNFRWDGGANKLSGMFSPAEDSAKREMGNQNPALYDAVYKHPWHVDFIKITPILDSAFSKILNERIKIPVPPPPPPIQTDIQHILTILEGDMKIELYDNGTVDGDIITLIVNGKIMSQHQKLSLAPITVDIKKEDLLDSNLIVMQAENLGDIPPNTALMLITVNGQRYDVNMSSTMEKQAGIMLYRKKNSNKKIPNSK